MTKAIIYTRFSPRPNAKECDSCEKQHQRCLNYIYEKGYVSILYCEDPDTTGGILEREGLSNAIKAIKESGDPDTVLVVDSGDRLARDMLVNLTIRHMVEEAGGRIEYADGSPTDTTPEGELFVNILAAFAQYERSRIRYRTSRGLKRRQANGEWFGRPPIGYMLNPDDRKQLIANENERKLVTCIKNLNRKGYSAHDIAYAVLYEETFRGKPLTDRKVRHIIKKKHDWEE